MEYITSISFHSYHRVHLLIHSQSNDMLLSNKDDINRVDSITNVKNLDIECIHGNNSEKLKLQLMKRFPNLDYFSMKGKRYFEDEP